MKWHIVPLQKVICQRAKNKKCDVTACEHYKPHTPNRLTYNHIIGRLCTLYGVCDEAPKKVRCIKANIKDGK